MNLKTLKVNFKAYYIDISNKKILNDSSVDTLMIDEIFETEVDSVKEYVATGNWNFVIILRPNSIWEKTII